jgi:nucleoside 2-deoxyribosyltransferase
MALIDYLKQYGEVLTEYVGDKYLSALWSHMSPREIHDKDMAWLLDADVVVADVTIASLWVGYELGRAVAYQKPILCLYRAKEDTLLSAMIDGSPWIHHATYTTLDEAKWCIDSFFTTL